MYRPNADACPERWGGVGVGVGVGGGVGGRHPCSPPLLI